MNITLECRYLYIVPKGNKYYPHGHYGSITAISMYDAKNHLARWCRGAIVIRARLGEEGCYLADWGDQEYRKALFDEAIEKKQHRSKK